MQAIQIQQHGGPEVLDYREVPTPQPGAGEALVKIAASGINYIDVYNRTGLYPNKTPLIIGQEAAGTIEAVGPDVSDVKVGDRVAYCSVMGSYADYAVVPAARLVPIPDGLDERQAAAAMLQGMTAHYLSQTTYPIQKDDTVLVHAAAGGVGLLLTQMAKMRGARVIGTVSTEEKARLARDAGADDVILYTDTDFETEVKELTNNQKVAAVYDSVGKTTFDKGLNVLRPRGYMVLYGASSGPVPAFEPAILNGKGSLFLTRPSLHHYTASREELLARAGDVLGWIASGQLKLRIEHLYPMAEAKRAHEDLQGRRTTGKLLLLNS